MYKQDYLEVFINDANRITIQSGNSETPDLVSIDPHDLSKLADVLVNLRDELIDSGELEAD
jgi:hypothetical protein